MHCYVCFICFVFRVLSLFLSGGKRARDESSRKSYVRNESTHTKCEVI